jgi:phage repressor protein C with HTH and peptisase S24 domain
MYPRLNDGDLVLIDTQDKVPGPRKIMAVYFRGQGSALGIIHKVSGMSLLTKANIEYPPVLMGDDAIIRGAVKKRLESTAE